LTSSCPERTEVLIVGAGPTGLTLATALLTRGVGATVIDRLPDSGRFRQSADALPVHADGLPGRPGRVLLQRLAELGGQVLRPHALADLSQDPLGVTATLEDGRRLRARYVVGADGMHSIVRDRSGIRFVGGNYGKSFVLADVPLGGRVASDEVVLYLSAAGLVVVAPMPYGIYRIVAAVDEDPENPSRAFVQALLDTRGPLHDPVVVRNVVWGSRFRIHHRVADVYRIGRVLLAGDAAHVHSPAQQIVALADRLTRLATVRPTLRPFRNLLLGGLAQVPTFRRRLAWQLSGLAYR
jgi:2-polyprenyl-6-methoxyphenol hydroxylase-like FAD-dependent oxidoreductase